MSFNWLEFSDPREIPASSPLLCAIDRGRVWKEAGYLESPRSAASIYSMHHTNAHAHVRRHTLVAEHNGLLYVALNIPCGRQSLSARFFSSLALFLFVSLSFSTSSVLSFSSLSPLLSTHPRFFPCCSSCTRANARAPAHTRGTHVLSFLLLRTAAR